MTDLRDYQVKLDDDITAAHNAGARNVLAVAPCGAGKTVNMAQKFKAHVGASVGIAHRQELVSQMSLALARNGVYHRVIGQDSTIRACVRIHMEEVGRSFFNPNALCGVAGVDTLVRRPEESWFRQVGLWQTDEAHHVLKENKWGKAAALFPNARGIGWTATPCRADGYGLGSHADGIMDAMVLGPTPRELITRGYLTEYEIWCPPSDLDVSHVPLSAGGDFSPLRLRDATHASSVVGDIVKHYCKIAPGKLGITFAVDVEDAVKISKAYNAAGVPAEVVTSDTPDAARQHILRRFRTRHILQLVNVDLFGEGFDVPAIEVVSMGRATASFALYYQQFFRALRLLAGKPFGIIIDHVGNVVRHGLPDRPRVWSLDRRERGRSNSAPEDAIPVRPCPGCTRAYLRILTACPYCHYVPVPAGRGSPDQVDGDLEMLDPAVLAALRGEVARIDAVGHPPPGLTGLALAGYNKRHLARQQAQARLRAAISLWAGWQAHQGRTSTSEQQRLFFFTFRTDVLTAQALGATEADELAATVSAVLARNGVVAAA